MRSPLILAIRTGIPKLPASQQAERTLPPLEYLLLSGNTCTVECVVRTDRGDPTKVRGALAYAWHHAPSPQDKSAVESDIAAMISRSGMTSGPKVEFGSGEKNTAARARDEFLNPAKPN